MRGPRKGPLVVRSTPCALARNLRVSRARAGGRLLAGYLPLPSRAPRYARLGDTGRRPRSRLRVIEFGELAGDLREVALGFRGDLSATLIRGLTGVSGSRFLLCGHEPNFGRARSSAGVLGGRSTTRDWLLLRAASADATGSARPRVPDVRHCGARALLRGVRRKGRRSRLAALAQAPPCTAHRTRPRRSAKVRRERQPAME